MDSTLHSLFLSEAQMKTRCAGHLQGADITAVRVALAFTIDQTHFSQTSFLVPQPLASPQQPQQSTRPFNLTQLHSMRGVPITHEREDNLLDPRPRSERAVTM